MSFHVTYMFWRLCSKSGRYQLAHHIMCKLSEKRRKTEIVFVFFALRPKATYQHKKCNNGISCKEKGGIESIDKGRK